MKYRALGNSGIVVSEIGFGAWGIGGGAYGKVRDEESVEALRTAFENGIIFYDTANIYGNGHSEELIASVFKGKRDKVLIATKGGTLPHSGFHMPQDFSAGHLEKALTESLKRLQTDYVDLYQLHSPPLEMFDRKDEVVGALERFKQEGLIREFGISTRSPADAKVAVEEYGFPVVQVNFNLIDQRAVECEFFDVSMKKGVGVINRTPLVFGFLTGSLSGDEKFDEGDHRANWPKDQLGRWAESADLFSFLEANGRTRVQAALRFCLDQEAVSVVIPGMLNPEQVFENTLASELPPLSREEFERIRDIYRTCEFYDKGAKGRGKQI